MTLLVAFPLWQARGPRFLLLLLVFWVMIRLAAQISVPGSAVLNREGPFAMESRSAPNVAMLAGPPRVIAPAPRQGGVIGKALSIRQANEQQFAPPVFMSRLMDAGAPPDHPPLAGADRGFWSAPDPHRWRFAMFDSWLGGQRRTANSAVMVSLHRYPPGHAAQPPPPFWPAKAVQPWSLSLYSYWRGNSPGQLVPFGNRPQALGGSQTAARLDYAVGDSGRTRLFLRLTATPTKPVQADASIGAAFRPIRALPVDVIAEQRFALTAAGSNATLVYAAGGVDDVPVAAGFALSAYGQGGLVRTTDIRAFADAAVAVERPLARQKGLVLSAGAIAAGAVQTGATRIDVGPRATLRLAEVGEGARLSLDWRARVAGDAAPASGFALTLAAGF